jgi:hypothetical protein
MLTTFNVPPTGIDSHLILASVSEPAFRRPRSGMSVLGSLFTGSGEKFARALRNEGVKADLAFQRNGYIVFGSSVVTVAEIQVSDCPIQTIWLEDRWQGGGSDGPDCYAYTLLDAPDQRLASLPAEDTKKLRIWATRHKSFPFIGKVLRIEWKGAGHQSQIVEQLNAFAYEAWMLRASRCHITVDTDHAFWRLEKEGGHTFSLADWEAWVELAKMLQRAPLLGVRSKGARADETRTTALL